MSVSSLRSLSDRSLISQLKKLVRREHESTIHVLLHLGEVERRKLYRDYGCSSMFTYCTERLRYSASAAARRLRTARAIRSYPRVLELLTRCEVNLTTVDMVAGIVFERKDPSLFERIRGKTQGEVADIVATYRPKQRLRDRVEPVYVECRPTEARSEPLLGEGTAPSAATVNTPAQPGKNSLSGDGTNCPVADTVQAHTNRGGQRHGCARGQRYQRRIAGDARSLPFR